MNEPSTSDIRAWARQQGLQVSDYGRLPLAVTEAYREAHVTPGVAPAQQQVPAAERAVGRGSYERWPFGEPPELPPRGTNGWSVAALVLALLGLAPVALACGVVGFRQTRRSGQAGRGLAISGLVLGVLGTIGIAALVLTDDPVQRADNGQLIGSGQVPLADLRTGDCLVDIPFESPEDPIDVQPCQGLHAAEVFFAFEAAGADYPGQEVLQRAAQSKCSERLRDTPLVAPVETYELLTIVPTQERWEERDRRMHCLITSASSGELVDSLTPRRSALPTRSPGRA